MPTFTFTDSAGRTYSNLAGGPLVVVPGESYELDECPSDGRWEASQSAPEAPVTPATTSTDEGPVND